MLHHYHIFIDKYDHSMKKHIEGLLETQRKRVCYTYQTLQTEERHSDVCSDRPATMKRGMAII